MIYRYFLPFLVVSTVTGANGQGVGHDWRQPCAIVEQLGVSWYYDWTSNPTCGNSRLEAVPMLRKSGDWSDKQGGNSPWLLGFNEPDRADQANLTPAQGATAWRTVEERFPGKRLVSPAPSGPGLAWLPAWRDAYWKQYGTWPRLDALAVHCYLPTEDCRAIITQAAQWAAAWDVPEVWLTEFGTLPCYYPTTAASLRDAETFRSWLVTQPQVTRYAWFATVAGGCWPSLTDGGVLNAYGRWYVEAR